MQIWAGQKEKEFPRIENYSEEEPKVRVVSKL